MSPTMGKLAHGRTDLLLPTAFWGSGKEYPAHKATVIFSLMLELL